MAYLELSKEAYDDLIRAAGMKAGAVAKVCNEQGMWSPEAQAEAPPDVAEPDTHQGSPFDTGPTAETTDD